MRIDNTSIKEILWLNFKIKIKNLKKEWLKLKIKIYVSKIYQQWNEANNTFTYESASKLTLLNFSSTGANSLSKFYKEKKE